MSVCRLMIENWNLLSVFRGLIIFGLVVTVLAVAFRAKNESGDLSFLFKSYFQFELFNWKKYGFFSFLVAIPPVVLLAIILFGPSFFQFCFK